MHKDICRIIGDMAVDALKLEAATTPKPGLVDKANNGAHKDMDFSMFLASAESLRDCFTRCAAVGADTENLRSIGMEGERSMFLVTKNVNTHKGLIFSMGILCGALGELVQTGEHFDEKMLQGLCAKLAAELLSEDTHEKTHGREVLEKTGIKGIRGEALSGFASAFSIGLPTLRTSLAEGYTFNQAMVKTLLALMTKTADSNLVHRGGEKGLRFAQEHAGAILCHVDLRRDADMELVSAFDEICIEKNLSPGGSADLLALSAMLYLFFERKEE